VPVVPDSAAAIKTSMTAVREDLARSPAFDSAADSADCNDGLESGMRGPAASGVEENLEQWGDTFWFAVILD
jgi:hypothetical protein